MSAIIKNPKNIIISRTDKIGDLVLSIPSFVAIRNMYKDATIHALVREYNAPIVQNLSCIDNIISIDSYDDKELLQKIKDINADLFIALYSDKKTLNLAKQSKIKYRVGPLSKLKSFFVYNKGVFQKRSLSKQNEAMYNLDLIKKVDSSLFNQYEIQTEKIKYKDEDNKQSATFLLDNDIKENDFILIHPFTGGSAKNISIDNYIDVITKVKEKLPLTKIVVSCAQNDEKEALYIKSKVQDIYIFKSEGTILTLAALIDKCKVFVGGSTGPSHIAGNLNKRCVCLYPLKPTMSPTRWGLFLNNKTTYLSPDKDNPNENYKVPIFDIVTLEFLNTFANVIVESFLKND